MTPDQLNSRAFEIATTYLTGKDCARAIIELVQCALEERVNPEQPIDMDNL